MGGGGTEEEEKEEEKIPLCESIGHRPPSGPLPCFPLLNFNNNLLWQSTGTANHLRLLRLFTFWAAAPKGPMTYAFTQEKFLLLLLLFLLRTPP